MGEKKKILSFGEVLYDVYPGKKTLGGAPLNFAAHAVRCGAESALLSAVGRDADGREATDDVKKLGVSTRFLAVNDCPTGRCEVTVDKNGIPSYKVLAGAAYDRVRVTPDEVSALRSERFDALYFGTLAQRDPVSREALCTLVREVPFPDVFCDVNLRAGCYDTESVLFCLRTATLLKVSDGEARVLREMGCYGSPDESAASAAKALAGAHENLKAVVVTCGADGAVVYDAMRGETVRQAAVGDRVVSTVGAGDSFAAAFLTGYLAGMPLGFCMRRAATVSGIVVANTGAVPAYTLPEEYRIK